MKPEITDAQIALMLKSALEFNATLVGMAAVYYGNMDAKNAKRFKHDYKNLFAQYRADLKAIFKEEVEA